MADEGIGVVLGLIAIGLTCYWHYNLPEKPKQPLPVGRYEIVRENDFRAYLIDTATGESYSWYILNNAAGQRIEEGWQHASNAWLDSARALNMAPLIRDSVAAVESIFICIPRF